MEFASHTDQQVTSFKTQKRTKGRTDARVYGRTDVLTDARTRARMHSGRTDGWTRGRTHASTHTPTNVSTYTHTYARTHARADARRHARTHARSQLHTRSSNTHVTCAAVGASVANRTDAFEAVGSVRQLTHAAILTRVWIARVCNYNNFDIHNLYLKNIVIGIDHSTTNITLLISIDGDLYMSQLCRCLSTHAMPLLKVGH